MRAPFCHGFFSPVKLAVVREPGKSFISASNKKLMMPEQDLTELGRQ